MKANEYLVLERAIEEGITFGLMRAYKHTDLPKREDMIEAVRMSVMNEIATWFKFEEAEE